MKVERLTILMTAKDKKLWARVAKTRGMTVSDLVRSAMAGEIDKPLKQELETRVEELEIKVANLTKQVVILKKKVK